MIVTPTTGKGRSEDMMIDLTSLIDVLFTLLIFFILTMGATQIATEIQLPGAEHYQEIKHNSQKPLVIEISHSQSYWKIDDQRFRDFKSLTKQIRSHYLQDLQRPVLIGLEPSLPVEKLTKLLNFLAVYQFSNIQIISEWKT